MGHPPLVTAGLLSGAAVLALAAPAHAVPTHVATGHAAPVNAAPANAAPEDQPVATYSPHAFKAGANLWVRVDGCLDEPRLEGANEAFDGGEPASFDRVGGTGWRGIGGTLTTLKPGNSYMTRFGCTTPSGHQTFPLWVTPPDPQVPPPRKQGSAGTPARPPGSSTGGSGLGGGTSGGSSGGTVTPAGSAGDVPQGAPNTGDGSLAAHRPTGLPVLLLVAMGALIILRRRRA
ncbi:hypothetical protein [Spirillospora sp. NPDC047279]|uniref:hypothetical protein n=1 Tax=Spirillospora sp. NPDC047279 TaxID=3155478 RepID=UPI0033D31DD7